MPAFHQGKGQGGEGLAAIAGSVSNRVPVLCQAKRNQMFTRDNNLMTRTANFTPTSPFSALSYRPDPPPHPHRGASGWPLEMGRRSPGGGSSSRKALRQFGKRKNLKFISNAESPRTKSPLRNHLGPWRNRK